MLQLHEKMTSCLSLKHGFAVSIFLATQLVCSHAYSQPPQPGKYSPEKYEVVEELNRDAAMRDGAALKIDIFRPKQSGRFPAVLLQTPYNKSGQVARAKKFAARGYVVVNVDSRGRFESEGEWDPFSEKHKTDG